jgi:hypothetical protein
MRRTCLWLAAAVVVVSNSWALGLAALNRQGEPDAVLQLTEREVPLVPGGPENTAASLRLAWTGPRGASDDTWFDQATLAALGFDCSVPLTRETATHYAGRPARRVYAALEYDGPAWQRYAAGLAPDIDTTSANGVSHLMLVDLDRDAARLRARHPDRARVAIVHAVVVLRVVSAPGREPRLQGQVLEILPSDLNVPRDLRPDVEPIAPRANQGRPASSAGSALTPPRPRYGATIRWGSRFEPWIETIRMTGARQ